MFARLFLADLFIHGLGGALYDQITDHLLASTFHCSTPYACVSAAWLLPLAQPHESTATLSQLHHTRHHIFHNPQLAIPTPNPLLDQRQSLLTQLQTTPDRPTRQRLFRQLHALNAQLHTEHPAILKSLDTKIAQTLQSQQQNKTLLWREYFFALHSKNSLQALIGKIRDM